MHTLHWGSSGNDFWQVEIDSSDVRVLSNNMANNASQPASSNVYESLHSLQNATVLQVVHNFPKLELAHVQHPVVELCPELRVLLSIIEEWHSILFLEGDVLIV